MRKLIPVALAAASLLLTGCPLRWAVKEDDGRVREIVQRYRPQLEKAVTLMNQAKLPVPLQEMRAYNHLTFEIARDQPMLAFYTLGKDVGNNMSRFQRAVGSLGDAPTAGLRLLNQAGLLEPNPDYASVKLGVFYRVKDAIMSSEIGGVLTAEGEAASFYFPLAAAKGFAERKLGVRELVEAGRVVGDGDEPVTGRF